VAQQFTAGGDLAVARGGFTATRLADDRVVIAGGCCGSSAQGNTAEVFTPASQTFPRGQVGESYSATIAGFGAAPNAFSIKAGTLPWGLSLNATSGAISGTPGAAGTFRLVIDVVDSSSPARRILREVTIQVDPGSGGTTSVGPVGGLTGGTPFSFGCSGAMVGTGLKVYAGDDIDRTELWCSDRVGNSYVNATLAGSAGSAGSNPLFDFSCAAGKALTGVHGRAGTVQWGGIVVDTLGATCTNLATGETSQSSAAGNVSSNFGVPPLFSLNCPAGKAVVGLFGGQGGLLDRIGLICR